MTEMGTRCDDPDCNQILIPGRCPECSEEQMIHENMEICWLCDFSGTADKFHQVDERDSSRTGKEPRPPYCVCCEYMRVCDKDKQKASYCPDPNYRKLVKKGK